MFFYLTGVCSAQEKENSIGPPPGKHSYKSEKVEVLKKKIIFDKKKLNVMENIQLSSKEEKLFWPIYREYQMQLVDLDVMRTKLFSFYVTNRSSLTNQQISKVMDEMFAISDSRQDVLKRFSLALEDVLPAKRVFNYLLIEKNQAAIEQYNLLQQIPLPK